MRFKATDIYDYYRPSECERRVALRARKEPEQETDSPFDTLLRNLGHLHEAAHLATLPAVVDLNPDTHDQPTRERLTLESIRANAPAIYQPRFRLEFPLDGEPCELIGEPDFLIRDPARRGYVIRDSKLARNIESRRHLAIPLQLKIYAFLFERLVGKPPLGLEVHAGTGEIVPVKYEGEEEVLKALRDHLRMRAKDPAGLRARRLEEVRRLWLRRPLLGRGRGRAGRGAPASRRAATRPRPSRVGDQIHRPDRRRRRRSCPPRLLLDRKEETASTRASSPRS